jgi:hypothetical protein
VVPGHAVRLSSLLTGTFRCYVSRIRNPAEPFDHTPERLTPRISDAMGFAHPGPRVLPRGLAGYRMAPAGWRPTARPPRTACGRNSRTTTSPDLGRGQNSQATAVGTRERNHRVKGREAIACDGPQGRP